jgi:hypothetical protein
MKRKERIGPPPVETFELSPGRHHWIRWFQDRAGSWQSEMSEQSFPTEKSALIEGLCAADLSNR